MTSVAPTECIESLDRMHQDACARVQDLHRELQTALGTLATDGTGLERIERDLAVERIRKQWREAVEVRDHSRRAVLEARLEAGWVDRDEYLRECQTLDEERERRLRRHGARDMVDER